MCGRYYVEIDEKDLADICNEVQKNLENTPEQLSFNMTSGEVFPTNIVPIRVGDKDYKAMKWGFTGYDGKPIINARSETALIKPTFKVPMQTGRCLIPASGYYEWQRAGGRKQKYSFTLPDRKIMYMAGCYRLEEGNRICSFVILTRPASAIIKDIHDRMPVLIPEGRTHDWLYDSYDAIDEAVNELEYRLA